MKYIIAICNRPFLVIGVALFLIAGCKKDFLDNKPLAVINEQAVFKDSLRSLGVINNLYSNAGISFNPRRYSNQGLEGASDEAESSTSLTAYPWIISNGGANSSNTDKGVWSTVYSMIRASNIFLKNKDSIPVIRATKDFWAGQARFLRAWYYFTLIKHYGGMPLIGNAIFSDEDKIDIPRSSYEACVNYIAAECDTAAALLPLSFSAGSADRIRVTKGSALALKARLLLYAASPLFNSGPRSDDPEHLLSYATADNERWKKAMDAANAVIALNQYSLYKGSSPYFYNLFIQTSTNVEQIFSFFVTETTANKFYVENVANPPSRSSGNGYAGASNFPLQELVDEFDMSNGLRISDPASGYTGVGDNMYLNRDPRFYATISYNGAMRFFGGYNNQPVNTYTGVIPSGTPNLTSASVDGIYTSGGTKTGYYRYKMLNNNSVSGGSELYRPWMLIRYAEILLNAAEATNEYSGPTAQVYTWLKDIRDRAGITPGTNGLYGLKASMTKDEMRAAIQHERRVEFAFEEQRYWDVRRWKIAPTVENAEMHGMEITRAASGAFTYRLVTVRKHVFTDAMYFWPLPQSEITKSPSLKQNPGY